MIGVVSMRALAVAMLLGGLANTTEIYNSILIWVVCCSALLSWITALYTENFFSAVLFAAITIIFSLLMNMNLSGDIKIALNLATATFFFISICMCYMKINTFGTEYPVENFDN